MEECKNRDTGFRRGRKTELKETAGTFSNRNKWSLLLLLLFVLQSGCASKWEIHTQASESPLQWPYLPAPPRIVYLMSVSGFEEKGASLSTLVFGRQKRALVRPTAVAAGSDGRIAIADQGTHSVHLYIPGEEKYTTIGRAGSEEIVSPVAVQFDKDLKLYISDSVLRKILIYDRNGVFVSAIGKAGDSPLGRPAGLAFSPDGNILFTADTLADKIHAFTREGGHLFSFGESGTGQGQFNFPTHIFVSGQGRLYVVDAMNFRVQIFDMQGGFISSFGHHGDGSGDFAMPKGIVLDKNGVIYIVDSLFDNVQLFNEKGDFLLTLGRQGGGHGEFWLPSGLSIDQNGKLYLCDTFNRRIQIFQTVGGGHE